MIDRVSRGEIEGSSNALDAHFGGQPAINGYSAQFS
jgi:1-aminocyclopropane-1-carboxylate deaminase